jgi:predicted DNA-binding transcriptional regulator AlpA
VTKPPKSFTDHVRDALRTHMRDYDITYRQLYKATGVGEATIYRYLANESITTVNLDKLIRWLESEGFVWSLAYPDYSEL